MASNCAQYYQYCSLLLSPDSSVLTGGTPLHWAVARGGDGQVRAGIDVDVDVDVNIDIDVVFVFFERGV